MGATAVLSSPSLAVEAGEEVSCEVTVRNNGTVVDQFTFEVLGNAAPWSAVEPASLSLFPDAEESVLVWFRPPRSADVPAGSVPFAVRVSSREDPEGSVVEEGILEISHFVDAFAELSPRTSRGRRAAWHDLSYNNRGNSRVESKVTAADPDKLLSFVVSPPRLGTEPGAASFARVRVTARKLLWRGTPQTIPFQVTVTPDGATPTLLDGSMVQEPVIPGWVPRAVAVGLALLMGAAIVWRVVLKPTVENAAAQAVAAPLQAADKNIQDLASKVGTSVPPIGNPNNPNDPTATTLPGTGALGEPINGRIEVNDGAGNGEPTAEAFDVGDGQALSITDLVVQNPNGDRGRLEIKRGEEVILVEALENLRDLDFHFVAPIVLREEDLVVEVECDQEGKPQQQETCEESVSFVGFLTSLQPAQAVQPPTTAPQVPPTTIGGATETTAP
jgi:hypothetical protein